MKNKLLLIFAGVVLLICGGAIWFLQQSSETVPPAPATGDKATVQPVTAPDRGVPVQKAQPVAETKPAPAPQVARPLEPWEVKIDQIISSKVGETEMAQMLINLMATTPDDGKVELASHITNLLPDKEYKRVLPLIRNPNLPADVLDVFVTDLMNREDYVKLPTLLEVAKLPNHPNREEALTDLTIFLDQDNGTDWAKWDAALKAYLKKQAEENPPDNAP